MYVYCYAYVDKRALDNSLDLEDDNSFGFYVSFVSFFKYLSWTVSFV